jgi:TPP-dependent pyruvate/acetoin dehydrogenase alpha subunit
MKDSVKNFCRQLVEAGVVQETEVEGMIREAREQIERAAHLAARATDPDPRTIYEGLFSDTSSTKVDPSPE